MSMLCVDISTSFTSLSSVTLFICICGDVHLCKGLCVPCIHLYFNVNLFIVLEVNLIFCLYSKKSLVSLTRIKVRLIFAESHSIQSSKYVWAERQFSMKQIPTSQRSIEPIVKINWVRSLAERLLSQ